MPNQHVIQRLTGIQAILNGVHQSNIGMSSSSKGSERESFIDEFLSKVFPPVYRFGTGDATDTTGNRSGQLDVVMEYPFGPSLPSVGAGNTRLYLAESIASVIEVKSDVANQWDQVQHTAAQLAPLKRIFQQQIIMGGPPPSTQIPLFVASYTGWKQPQTIIEKVNKCSNVAGVLVINPGIFISSPQYGGIQATGPFSLWGLISCLHIITNTMQVATTDPISYAT